MTLSIILHNVFPTLITFAGREVFAKTSSAHFPVNP